MKIRPPIAGFRRPAAAAGALACLAALPGCGASTRPVPLGAQVFAASCRSCHSLIGTDSLRRVGGDLVAYRLGRADMLQLVREMPVPHALTPAQSAAVGDYVLSAERRAARGCSAGSC